MSFCLSVSAVCDIGCKKPNNEDMILVNTEIFRDGKRQAVFSSDNRVVIAVADGVGGLNKGEVASERVLTALKTFLENIPDDLNNNELKEVFDIYTLETHNSLPKDMGSTLVGLFFYQQKVFRFHAGDSRIYRFRNGMLDRLTVDHSLRELGGDPTAPSNVITNAIGGGTTVFIDFAQLDDPLMNNDVYLLSSDGMHDLVNKNEILSEIKKPKAAEILTELAKKRGGKDNISVVTINIKS